jgi:hypothetical protein
MESLGKKSTGVGCAIQDAKKPPAMIKFKKICWHHWQNVVVQIGHGTIVGK